MMKQDQQHFENNIDNDDFDNFLAKQLQQAQPYLADNDFTATVMSQLPVAKKLSVWQERLIILIPFLIISLLVLSQFSVLAVVVKVWSLVVGAQVASLLQLGLLITLAVISGASLWFAKQFKLI
jgi:hypothetical protein